MITATYQLGTAKQTVTAPIPDSAEAIATTILDLAGAQKQARANVVYTAPDGRTYTAFRAPYTSPTLIIDTPEKAEAINTTRGGVNLTHDNFVWYLTEWNREA